MYDALVVGARVAGSSTAMLLARRGLNVSSSIARRFPATRCRRISPRRTILDHLLVQAARGAGAEVREGFTVDELLFDGDRVVGIRGRERGSGAILERARIVIG